MNRRILALISAATLTLIPPAFSSESTNCGGGPGVFNVFNGGRIDISNNGNNQDQACNVTFSGSKWVNVKKDNLNKPRNPCSVEASGYNVRKLIEGDEIPIFPDKQSDSYPSIKYYNQGVNIDLKIDSNDLRLSYDYQNSCYFYFENNIKKCIDEYQNIKLPSNINEPFEFSNEVRRDFNKIENWSGKLVFKYNKNDGPYYIHHLVSINDGNVLNFEPGDYYIDKLEIGTFSVINVLEGGDGSGQVRLYIKEGSDTTLIGHNSCFNIKEANTTDTCKTQINNPEINLDQQSPEKLAFYFYDGDVKLGDTIKIAASIYAHNGAVDIRANSGTTFIGEIAAQNINVGNNSNVYMHYKNTGVFDLIYPEFDDFSMEGEYSLSTPLTTPFTYTDSYVYVATNEDPDDNEDGIAKGHLKAYKLKDNGYTGTKPVWDAANNLGGVFGSITNKTYTYIPSSMLNPTPILTAFATLFPPMTYNVSSHIDYVKNNLLNHMGRPLRFDPVFFGDKVVVGTDDGVLYAFDKNEGEYKWGFVAPQALLLLSDPNKSTQRAWTSASVWDNKLIASGMEGKIHVAIVEENGVPKVLWEDNGDLPITSEPARRTHFAGQTVAYIKADKNNNDDVEYKLVTRTSNGTDTGDQHEFTILLKPTSHPLVYPSLGTFVGTEDGKVFITSGGSLQEISTNNWLANPVLFLNGMFWQGKHYLIAASAKQVMVLRYNGNGNWEHVWTWGKDGFTTNLPTNQSDTDNSPSKLPEHATITAQPMLVAGSLLIPVTVEDPEDCSLQAYYYGPYAISSASLALGMFQYRGKNMELDKTLVGYGEALTGAITILNGRIHIEGHSGQNLNTIAGHIDDPFGLTGLPASGGRRGWREIRLW